jgi:hypothetical protein
MVVIMNNELRRMGKEAVLGKFTVPSRHSGGGTDEIYEESQGNWHPGRQSNQRHPK